MKGDLSLETIGIVALTLIAVGVFSTIIIELRGQAPELHPIEKSLKGSDYPVCEEFDVNQTVDKKGFRTLMYAKYLDVCETNNTVELGFVLDRELVKRFSGQLSDKPEVIFRSDCQDIPGLEGFVVESSEQKIGGFGDKIALNGTRPVKICQR